MATSANRSNGAQPALFELNGTKYVVIKLSQYHRLLKDLESGEDDHPPALPAPDSQGNFPAVEYARASLARKLLRRRRAAGLTQSDLARRAGIRVETLNRLEKGKTTPSVATVDKLARALDQAEREAQDD